MIQRTPEERRRYNDRLKFERDEKARLLWALEEGKAEGKVVGKTEEKMSTINMLESVLQIEQTPMPELQACSLSMLDARIEDLKNRLRSRMT